jgi:hypothetical protein
MRIDDSINATSIGAKEGARAQRHDERSPAQHRLGTHRAHFAIITRAWSINAPDQKTELAEHQTEGNKGSQGGSAAETHQNAKNWLFRGQFSPWLVVGRIDPSDRPGVNSPHDTFFERTTSFTQTLHAILVAFPLVAPTAEYRLAAPRSPGA